MMMPPAYRPLATRWAGRATTTATIHFLLDLWSCHADGYTFLGTRRGPGANWVSHPIGYDREDGIRSVLTAYPVEHFDIYFSPNSFSEPRSLACYALPTPYAWNDIDDADPDGFDPKPNILWETSPRRFQGIWRWRNKADGPTAEQYSRNIWRKDGGDTGGWSVSKMLRLPGTINQKQDYNRPPVRLIRLDPKPQRLPMDLAFIRLSDLESVGTVDPLAYRPSAVLKKYRRALGVEVSQLISAKRVFRSNRSKRVFQIIAGLAGAGASDDEIASVLWVNPFFTDKWGQNLPVLETEIARVRARAEIGR